MERKPNLESYDTSFGHYMTTELAGCITLAKPPDPSEHHFPPNHCSPGRSPPIPFHRNILQRSSMSSVQFSHSVVSDSLQPHESQHARPPCPSTIPGVHANPCPLSQWCHPTISSSVVPFSFSPQSVPLSGSFQMSQLSASCGQSIGVLASTSVPPMNTRTDLL